MFVGLPSRFWRIVSKTMSDHTTTTDDNGMRAEAHRMLTQTTYGFLVTIRAGVPAARLTEHLAVDDDLTLWIGTSPASRKAAEIAANPATAYTVEDRDALGYVSAMGRASIDTSLERRRELWRPHLERFFPSGPEGDDFVLVRVATERVELMSFGAGIHPDPLGLASATLVRSDTGPGTTWAAEVAR